jgi:hypothetical protein
LLEVGADMAPMPFQRVARAIDLLPRVIRLETLADRGGRWSFAVGKMASQSTKLRSQRAHGARRDDESRTCTTSIGLPSGLGSHHERSAT